MINDFFSKLVIISVPLLVLIFAFAFFGSFYIKNKTRNSERDILNKTVKIFWAHSKLSISISLIFFLLSGALISWSFALAFLWGLILVSDVALISFLVKTKRDIIGKENESIFFKTGLIFNLYVLSVGLLGISVFHFLASDILNLIGLVFGSSLSSSQSFILNLILVVFILSYLYFLPLFIN